MPPVETSLTPFSRLIITIASAFAILAGLRAAAPVIGPVVVALLITIAWSPGSAWLRRKGWHPIVAALTGIVLGIIAIGLFVVLAWTSLLQLQEKLPDYQPRVAALRDSIETLLTRLPFDSSRILSGEALQPEALVGYALRFVGGITNMAGVLGVVILVMAFMMIEGVRYPKKLRDAVKSSDATAARVDSFVQSMRSYVTINAVVGAAAAVLNTILLLVLGVDFAILWGVVSFLLSFLPNVGFVLALAPPALLALLQFGLGRALAVVIGFTVINFIIDNVIKPRFVGTSLDISPAVVVISLVFWGWLIGPAGALLAVPLSIAAKYLFDTYDDTQWLAYLMSDKGEADDGHPVSRRREAKADG
jgi:AI-2 transport protein TqsA